MNLDEIEKTPMLADVTLLVAEVRRLQKMETAASFAVDLLNRLAQRVDATTVVGAHICVVRDFLHEALEKK